MSGMRYLKATFALALLAALGLVSSATPAGAATSATPVQSTAAHVQGYSGTTVTLNVNDLSMRYAPGGLVHTAASPSSPWSLTFNWGQLNGEWRLNLFGTPTYAGEPVLVSATETDSAGHEFVGNAKVTVNNVAVGSGVISTWVTVNWGSPIFIHLHYLAI